LRLLRKFCKVTESEPIGIDQVMAALARPGVVEGTFQPEAVRLQLMELMKKQAGLTMFDIGRAVFKTGGKDVNLPNLNDLTENGAIGNLDLRIFLATKLTASWSLVYAKFAQLGYSREELQSLNGNQIFGNITLTKWKPKPADAWLFAKEIGDDMILTLFDTYWPRWAKRMGKNK